MDPCLFHTKPEHLITMLRYHLEYILQGVDEMKFIISVLEIREGCQMRCLSRMLKDRKRPDEWEFRGRVGQILNRRNRVSKSQKY